MKLDQLRTSNYEYGLTKIYGNKIKEIHGYLSNEFDEPVFKMTKVEFENGITFDCEGEHDMPYLTGYDDKMSEEVEKISEQERKEE